MTVKQRDFLVFRDFDYVVVFSRARYGEFDDVVMFSRAGYG